MWILTIASVAGYLWIWGTLGTGDLTTRIVLEFMLGVIWTMVVVFIGGAILFVFGLGSFLFRGR